MSSRSHSRYSFRSVMFGKSSQHHLTSSSTLCFRGMLTPLTVTQLFLTRQVINVIDIDSFQFLVTTGNDTGHSSLESVFFLESVIIFLASTSQPQPSITRSFGCWRSYLTAATEKVDPSGYQTLSSRSQSIGSQLQHGEGKCHIMCNRLHDLERRKVDMSGRQGHERGLPARQNQQSQPRGCCGHPRSIVLPWYTHWSIGCAAEGVPADRCIAIRHRRKNFEHVAPSSRLATMQVTKLFNGFEATAHHYSNRH